MSSSRPVSFHQPRTTCGSTRWPLSTSHWIASVISSSPRADGSIARAASWIERHEHVDADEREVGRRLRRLLDQAHHRAVLAELGHAVVLRVRHGREQDQRLRLVLAELLHELLHAALEQVVAEVHHERRAAQERLGGQHGVGEAGGLVLEDVGDLDAELRAVAGHGADLVPGLGRDDDPDLADARRRHRLDAVEQHGLVGHRHELLGRGERDRPQPRAAPARQDQALEVVHGGRQPSTCRRACGGPTRAAAPTNCSPTRFARAAHSARLRLDRPRRCSARRSPTPSLEHARSRWMTASASSITPRSSSYGLARLHLQRAARVALEVADLLRLRVRPRPQLAVADHVPERHQMRPAVAAERGAGDHALLVEEGRDLLRRHRDLRPTAHAARAIRFSAASSTA